MMTLGSFWMCLLLTACNSGEASSANTPVEVSNAQDTAALQEEQQASVSASYMNGTNDQNKGDKTGPVRLHGTINYQGGGDVTLYETEGKNTFEIAKTRLVNNAFDFGPIEVNRGFYQLSLNGETNVTNVILNPDEPDLFIAFNANRLSTNRTASESVENTGWFVYSAEELKTYEKPSKMPALPDQELKPR